MIKVITDQTLVDSIKMAMGKHENLFHSFKAEISQNEERYITNQNAIIGAIVTQGELDFKLGLSNDQFGGTFYDLSNEEMESIKAQLKL